MLRLFIDTALSHSYLAIVKDLTVLKESYTLGSNNHSETLFPELESMLNELGVTLKDIEEIYVGIGPGSYTGVRIGVVIAKMLGVMNNSKVYKVSSLAFLASSKEGISYPFVDCRRGNAFSSKFECLDKVNRLEEDKVIKIDEYFNDSNKEFIITEGKPNPIKLIDSKEATIVDDINNLSPNYLLLVEAERIKKGLC